jgi:hypothetical protein
MVEHGAVRDIKNKIIALNCANYLDAFPEYQAFRTIDLAHRLGYRLDAKVRAFVRSRIDQATPEEFFLAVEKHRKEITREGVGNSIPVNFLVARRHLMIAAFVCDFGMLSRVRDSPTLFGSVPVPTT